jgi:hypothetical protein
MHRATIQGLRLVGNKLTAKEEEAYCKGTHKPRSPHHHNSPRHKSSSQHLGRHHQNIIKAQGMEEPKDLGLLLKHTTMKMMKKRWEHRALLAEFAPHW